MTTRTTHRPDSDHSSTWEVDGAGADPFIPHHRTKLNTPPSRVNKTTLSLPAAEQSSNGQRRGRIEERLAGMLSDVIRRFVDRSAFPRSSLLSLCQWCRPTCRYLCQWCRPNVSLSVSAVSAGTCRLSVSAVRRPTCRFLCRMRPLTCRALCKR